jgi:hypothetical protein
MYKCLVIDPLKVKSEGGEKLCFTYSFSFTTPVNKAKRDVRTYYVQLIIPFTLPSP